MRGAETVSGPSPSDQERDVDRQRRYSIELMLYERDYQSSRDFDRWVLGFSGGALAISLTLVRDVVVPNPNISILIAAWFSWGVSVVAMVWSIMRGRWAAQAQLREMRNGASVLTGEREAHQTRWANNIGFGSLVLGLALYGTFLVVSVV